MTDDLQRLRASRGQPSDVQDSEEEELSGIFGWLRGAKEKAAMLELRLKSGNSVAFSYGWLDKVEYNPSTGITLQFGTHTIQLLGKKLNAPVRPNVTLFDGLLRHRITWIQEAGQAESLASPSTITVTRILEK
jgi:hypothetical protein